jgi:hypothetical protein
MVYVRDDGVFDASVEKIWKYIQDPESHQHEAILSQKVLEQKGNVLKIRAELARPRGKAEETWQMRMDPPFGFELEVLDGPMKGSKSAHTYVPMGAKTKVIVVGDFHLQGSSDEEVRKGTLQYFEKVFNEDNSALKNF